MKVLKDDVTKDREIVLNSLKKAGFSYTDAMKSVSLNYMIFTIANTKCGLPYKIDYLYSATETVTDALDYQKQNNSLKSINDSALKSINNLSDKLLKTSGFTDKQIKDIHDQHILQPSEDKHKTKKMAYFDKRKESVDLNDYFAGKGYTVGQAKEICNWYLKTIDNSQQITKHDGIEENGLSSIPLKQYLSQEEAERLINAFKNN